VNLLILSSSTGGGHNMRASALKYWWEQNGGSAKISHPLENSFQLYKLGSNFYNFVQKYYPAFHNVYFHFLEFACLHSKKSKILGARSWLKDVSLFDPKIVVSVHAHLNHGYIDLLKEQIYERLKVVIYCGELADGVGFSRHWINPKADLFLGPFQETCKAAKDRGMPIKKTLEVGPLLRPAFYESTDDSIKLQIFNKYKIHPDCPIILLGTGANGVNRHLEVLLSLRNLDTNFQVIALCGSNRKTFSKIQAFKEKLKFNVIPLLTVNDHEMALFLREAKFLFARPGAGTTTEAVVCGTPMIFDLSRGVMPQEVNNLNFWEIRNSKIIKTNKPKNVRQYIAQDIPSIKIEIDSTPKRLLNSLEMLS
jgi:processive 1,2-diacylglycerol beta-glucosyltransferase